MAVTVDEVVVSLIARIGKYEADLRRAEQTFAGMQRKLESGAAHTGGAVTHHFDEMGRHIARSLAALAGIEGLRRFGESVVQTVEKADKLRSLAKLIGLTTTELQKLEKQAIEFGSSAEEMDQGLVFFTRQLGLAASGSGDLLKVLQANGVSLTDQNGKMRSTIDLLGTYSNLIRNAADEQAKLVLTTVGFGRGSAELANTFSIGADGMRKFGDEAERAGRLIESGTVDSLANIKPELDRLEDQFSAAWAHIILGFLRFENKVGEISHGLLDPVIEELRRIPNNPFLAGTKAGGGFAPSKGAPASGSFNPFLTGLPAGQVGGDIEAAKEKARAELIRQLNARAGLLSAGAQPAGKDELPTAPNGPKTVVPDFSPGPDTAKRWDEATKAIEADTAVLVEQAKQVSNTRFEQEKAVATQQLVNEAIRAGVEITPQLTEQIDKLATAHANAVVNLEKLEEAEGRLTDRIDAFKDGSKEVLRGFIDDLREGKDASEALYNALQNIESKLLDVALNSVFDALFGTSGQTAANRGGLLSSILGSLFGGLGGGGASAAASVGGGGIGHALTAARMPSNVSAGNARQGGASPRVNISFEPEIVPPTGMETNIESVSDGRGGQKPRVFFTQVAQEGLKGRTARTAAGLPARSFRRGG